MSTEYSLKVTPEQAKEMPMVDLAFLILKAANKPFYYRDLMQEISKIKVISEDEVMEVIAQLYTEINIDGRFACVGNNLWGLKRWYPVDKSDDAVGNTDRPRIINDDDDDLDDDEIFEDEDVDLDEEDSEDDDLFDDDDEEEVEDEVDEDIDEIEEDIDEDFSNDLDEGVDENEDDLAEDDDLDDEDFEDED